ncbi:putative thioredoxin reductase [Erysiphe neolycopersici]|uniref:Putative thioredoxin reductase n=1 Tax=Erysiphe neolycopersici TaxID=212602 RepID=A0A420HAK8_9PEZI|nr:putative thioredoxin reductase [Erysiphe neolycopersici]
MSLSIITTLVCIVHLFVGYSESLTVSKRSSNISETDTNLLKTHYDVIIVGGGPAGLSALCSLARVRHSVLLIDSGEYRNSPSRRVHDVIGSDGIPPALFRSKAREQAAKFKTATLQNGTVISIIRDKETPSFITTLSSGKRYTSRKIVLATGLRDILPNVTGIEEVWGRGMYWCVWCDGWGHRDQTLGIIASLPRVISGIVQILKLNKDVIAFVNGTDTPENRRLLEEDVPGWEKYMKLNGVEIENRTISAFERLQDGDVHRDEIQSTDNDKFRIILEDGSQITRDSFLASFPKVQHSYLGANIGVHLVGDRIYVDPSNMKAAPGVWGIGDANSDNSTNVPHALYSGKKAAVSIHFELGNESLIQSLNESSIMKRSESDQLREMENGLEDIWNSVK